MTAFASIKTKFIGPTDYRGSRISVTDDGRFDNKPRRLVVGWDYALNPSENHAAAASAWIAKFIADAADLPRARIADVGLAFGGEYFWTWEFDQPDPANGEDKTNE